jgi:hypothetical protein
MQTTMLPIHPEFLAVMNFIYFNSLIHSFILSFYSLSINPIESTVSCGCGDRLGYSLNYKIYSCHPVTN